MQHKQRSNNNHNKNYTHKRQDKGNQKYQVVIFNYIFKYPVISKFTVFKDVIITDNLQNLQFYQCSSKNMNQNMFRTKSRLLTQKAALKVSLFQFFY